MKAHISIDKQTRHKGFRSLLSGLLLSIASITSVSTQAMEVDELIRHIDELWRGSTSHSMMSMSVKTQRYQRNMSMETWSHGKDYSLISIRKPIKDKGIATLKVKQNIWNYLPKINRVTKVPSSMMSGSWMGSHFTNDDLVKENTYSEDYLSSISFEGDRNGKLIYEITSIPKPNAAVVWGKVVTQIEQESLVPYVSQYFDESGKLVRTMTMDQPRKIGSRIVPMRMILQPHDKPTESTVVTYENIEFDIPLATSFFSLQRLRSNR